MQGNYYIAIWCLDGMHLSLPVRAQGSSHPFGLKCLLVDSGTVRNRFSGLGAQPLLYSLRGCKGHPFTVHAGMESYSSMPVTGRDQLVALRVWWTRLNDWKKHDFSNDLVYIQSVSLYRLMETLKLRYPRVVTRLSWIQLRLRWNTQYPDNGCLHDSLCHALVISVSYN